MRSPLTLVVVFAAVAVVAGAALACRFEAEDD